MQQILYVVLGLVAGMLGGLFGIGGGVILVPAMVYLFGLTQHQAQGTTLALMVPPIGLLAALSYYYQGNVKVNMAIFICLGFLVGGWIGAHIAQGIPEASLKKIFGAFLLIIAIKMMVGK